MPATFGTWQSQDVGDPVALNNPDSLTAKLYNQLVTRVYTDPANSAQVMMLLAYGADQTDDLQLHRPEVCYPAFGFNLVRNEATKVSLAPANEIPARRLLAQSSERREAIIYWTRMGELLPVSGGAQRMDRLRIAMKGDIPDGILCRFSTLSEQSHDSWADLERFIPELMRAIAAKNRRVLIGSEHARLMSV